jgi:hypothetical protein
VNVLSVIIASCVKCHDSTRVLHVGDSDDALQLRNETPQVEVDDRGEF